MTEVAALNSAWLIRLRWGAIVGQIVTFAVVARVLALPVPLLPLGAVIAIEAGANVVSLALLRAERTTPATILYGLIVDVLLLTALLYFTGGPLNPFSFLYLVQISLAAVVLDARGTWALVILSLAGFGLLFVLHRPLAEGALSHADHMRIHLQGMWIAFGVAAAFIVYFLLRVRRSLEARERDLAEARAETAQRTRMASLATLAAGAAHELSTPLGTIALVAKELVRQLDGQAVADLAALREDAQLIRAEVDRCRDILEAMAADAGAATGEAPTELPLDELGQALARTSSRVALELPAGPSAQRPIKMPVRALTRLVACRVRHAEDADQSAAAIGLRVGVSSGALTIDVVDVGVGIDADVLARVGEPFFTTKPPGRGMGLGLFLARAVAERLGGGLSIESTRGRGTTVHVRVPVAA